jgi:hypothetical protein
VIKFIRNQAGSSLMLVMLAMGILSIGTYSLMKQNTAAKKSVKSIAQKKETELLERRIKAYLIDISICRENFEGNSILSTRSFNNIKKGGVVVLNTSTKYQNGSIQINSFHQKPLNDTSFYFELNYEKLKNQLGGKTISKKYKMSSIVDANKKIIDCYMNDEEEVTAAFDLALDKVCNGPGVAIGDPKCTVLQFDLANNCAPGEAVKSYTFVNNKLKLNCAPVVSTIGDGNLQCQFGLKATDTAGVFSCFELTDLVDSAEIVINEGDDCGVSFDSATNKIKLSCADCVALCPSSPVDPATVCQGDPIKFANSCGTADACTATGTKDCSTPPPAPSGNNYTCTSTGFSTAGSSCTPSSGASLCNSGATVNLAQSVCCSGSPSSTCNSGSSGSCTPQGCLAIQKQFGPATEAGCIVSHDDCGNKCKVTGSCVPNASTNNCLMCLDGPGIDPPDTSGGGCFLAGTEISLFNGSYKNIEKISKDDILMGTNGEPVKVESLISFDQTGYKYSINGSRFFVTGSHPFKTVQGWKAFEPKMAKLENPDLEIGQLIVGDAIYTEAGFEIVSIIDKSHTTQKVYNFQVDGKHEYIADKFQVHNKLDKPDCVSSDGSQAVLNCDHYGWGFDNKSGRCGNGQSAMCFCLDNGNLGVCK